MFSFIKNIFKETLHKACKKGDIEAVKQHLASGADVNAKDGLYGTTPLHHAAYEDHKEVAELLIDKGSDVNAGDKRGRTPLDWAVALKRIETADLLRKHGGKTKKELEVAGK